MVTLYRLIWSDFCSWYLEAIKPNNGELARATHTAAIGVFERLMTLLHPFLPFITEEVWHDLRERTEGEDCIVSSWPGAEPYDDQLIADFTLLQDTVSQIRDIRNQRRISHGEPLKLAVGPGATADRLLKLREGSGGDAGAVAFLRRAGILASIEPVTEQPANSIPFLIGGDTAYLLLNEEVDTAAERAKNEEELQRLRGFLRGVEKKLSNERFVSNAPEAVIALERKKQSDTREKIASLEAIIGG